jgi:hypothetical protein
MNTKGRREAAFAFVRVKGSQLALAATFDSSGRSLSIV